MIPSLEQTFTQDFGVRAPTALQRAICRIADGKGLGELAAHPDVVQAIGLMPAKRFVPKAMLLLCAVRGGKSTIAGAAAVRCAETCDTSPCGPGDIPRVPILSTHKDEAKVIMDHLLGAFRTSPRLASLLLAEPTESKGILMRHPTGRPIEIKVVAGSRAGASLAARFLAAVLFDEAAKMVGAEDGVVNLDHARRNVAGRLLSSACAPEWLISSPWAPFGPVYTEVVDHWQRPGPEIVVVRARGDLMNPQWWTPQRIAELERTNPDAYRTDFLAEFADPDSALIAGAHLELALRGPEDLPFEQGWEYAAEMDPGTRSNAWTLVVSRMLGRRTQIVLAKEWRGSKSKPLSSKEVLRDIASILAPYNIAHSQEGRRRIGTDQWSVDALRDIGKDFGLDLIEFTATRSSNDDGYLELARRFELGEVEIPDSPTLLSDLRRLRRITTAGGVRVDLPQTSDGRHCDYAPPIMRAAQRMTAQPKKADVRPIWKQEQDAAFEHARQKHGRKVEVPWWKRSA
jgi:hypothetical protein